MSSRGANLSVWSGATAFRQRLGHASAKPGTSRAPLRTRLMDRLMGINEALIDRYAAPFDIDLAPGDTRPWAKELEAHWRDIVAELDAVTASGIRLPLFGEAFRIDPTDLGLDASVSVHPDAWRTYVLRSFTGEIATNARRCPATMSLLEQVPNLTLAEFSWLEEGGRIGAHRAPNKGSLRYLLALRVPDPPGSCGLRVGEETVVWTEGRGVLFDHAINHEAWNEGEGDRVMLFLEMTAPLPPAIAWCNAITQAVVCRWYPGARGARRRIAQLDAVLNG